MNALTLEVNAALVALITALVAAIDEWLNLPDRAKPGVTLLVGIMLALFVGWLDGDVGRVLGNDALLGLVSALAAMGLYSGGRAIVQQPVPFISHQPAVEPGQPATSMPVSSAPLAPVARPRPSAPPKE